MDYLDIMDQLTDEQAGKLIKCVRDYHANGTYDAGDDNFVKLPMIFFVARWKEESKGDAYVYLAKMMVGTKSFLKIGVARTPSKRYATFGSAGIYALELDKKKFDSREDAIKLESLLIKKYAAHKLCPDIDFGGKTECFSLSLLEEIQEENILCP